MTSKPLNKQTIEELNQGLRQLKLISREELIGSAEAAGDGNMNITLRVQTSARSLIVKQSLPYVAKYPTIPAPLNRIQTEVAFYKFTEKHPRIQRNMPRLIDMNIQHSIAVFEDCGDVEDYSQIYNNSNAFTDETLQALADWLAHLHSTPLNKQDRQQFSNAEMQQLNHYHIFNFPLQNNTEHDLETICPGLSGIAKTFRQNTAFKKQTRILGKEAYLKEGKQLIHGDFFPGSILAARDRPIIIDPEFCNIGLREFDIGVFIAHLYLSKSNAKDADRFLSQCEQALPFDHTLAKKLAGVELMRRTIGVAQLPAYYSLKERQQILELAEQLVLN